MTATAVFVEILFAGVQSSVWITLALMGLFGVPSEEQISHVFPDAGGLLVIVAFAVAYTLGIINDRMARWCFSYVPKALLDKVNPTHYFKKKQVLDVDPLEQQDRMRILASEGKVTELLDFIRSRVRIARATAFNIPITIIAALFFVWRHQELLPSDTGPIEVSLAVLGIGFVVEYATLASFAMLLENYNRRKEQALQYCKEVRRKTNKRTKVS